MRIKINFEDRFIIYTMGHNDDLALLYIHLPTGRCIVGTDIDLYPNCKYIGTLTDINGSPLAIGDLNSPKPSRKDLDALLALPDTAWNVIKY